MLLLRTISLVAAVSFVSAINSNAQDEESRLEPQLKSNLRSLHALTLNDDYTLHADSQMGKVDYKVTKSKEEVPKTATRSMESSEVDTININIGAPQKKRKKRYMVKCKRSVTRCHDEILSTSRRSVKIVNDLPDTDLFAVEMDEEETDEVNDKEHVERVEDDPERFLLRPVDMEDLSTYEEYSNHNLRRELAQANGYGVANVNARAVWQTYGDLLEDKSAARGSRAKVCVIDTGIKASHNDIEDSRLSGSTVRGLSWNKDPEGHGSHVAGIIGATDNSGGILGVSPEINLHIIRVFDDNGVFASDLVGAMNECARAGANVISMSLGGSLRSYSEERAARALYEKGVLLVAASGNSGDTNNPVEYPAAYEEVMSVGAADSNKKIAAFSTYNDKVSLAAPGVRIKSFGTRNDNDYSIQSGTSMACPHVAGVAGLLFSIFDTATSVDVRDALEASAQGLGQCGNDDKFGHGHVDALAAANILQSGSKPPVTCSSTTVTIKPDNYGSETTWQIADPQGVAIAGGGPYADGRTREQITRLRLPELPMGECYTFTVFDAAEDGLCCGYGSGSYSVSFKGSTVASSTTFEGKQESKLFGCGISSGMDPKCGNGVVEHGEQCDDGNDIDDDDCSNDCLINSEDAQCGNGRVEPGEECDDGNRDNNDNCSNACIVNQPPECGNGIKERGEECDNGRDNNDNAACTSSCRNNRCGDGKLWIGVEDCDDGNNNNDDSCRNNCTEKSCGDNWLVSIWNQFIGRC